MIMVNPAEQPVSGAQSWELPPELAGRFRKLEEEKAADPMLTKIPFETIEDYVLGRREQTFGEEDFLEEMSPEVQKYLILGPGEDFMEALTYLMMDVAEAQRPADTNEEEE